MTDETKYEDNILVGRRKYGADFLALYLGTGTDLLPHQIVLCRYTVPGRTDVYSFDWVPGRTGVGDRVGYFSDHASTLRESLRLLERDLDKPQVVEMLVEACGKTEVWPIYRTFVEHFLPIVAPRSKSLRACKKALQEARQKRRAEYDRKKAERER